MLIFFLVTPFPLGVVCEMGVALCHVSVGGVLLFVHCACAGPFG